MAKNLYSPSMFKSYLNCKYTIFNEFYEDKLQLKRKEVTESDKLRLAKGNEFENDYFKELQRKYSKVVDLKKGDQKISKEDIAKETIKCMKEGYEIIRGGYLIDDKWRGEFDFLEINRNIKSNLGDYSYEVSDTKNTTKVKPDHIFQVAIYADLLEKIQGIKSKNFNIVLKEMKKESIELENVSEFVLMQKKKYEHFIENEIDTAKPEKCTYCAICPWQETCENIWKKNDSLDLIWGIRKDMRRKFQKSGIDTVLKLSQQDHEKVFEDINIETSKKYITFSKLMKKEEKTDKPEYLPVPVDPDLMRGLSRLPKPSKSDLFFDIESVQDHIVEGKLEYLFGLYYEEEEKKEYKLFWAHDKEQEKNNLIQFFNFIDVHFKKYPDSFIYHYGNYEIDALERLTQYYNEKEIELVHYLNKNKFVDLYSIARQAIFTTAGYSIKDLEKYYEFKRKSDIRKGQVSEEYYIKWLNTKEQKYLDEIGDYNKEDCLSTAELLKWFHEIRDKNLPWFEPKVKEINLRPREEKMQIYEKKLKEADLESKDLQKIVYDILGFYYRENKPEYRRYFSRKLKDHEELVEDTECIGNMKKYAEPRSNDKETSYIFTYTYDDQDFKLKKGDQINIANDLLVLEEQGAGTIYSIDYNKKIVEIKRTIKKKYLPDLISIGPTGPVAIDTLEQSIFKFVDSLVSKENKYSALKSVLTKQTPKIKGIKPGDKILKTPDYDKEIPEIISNLDESYLYIQGPPGTGKTRVAANSIIELLKRGKKVGITGNSHKVIHNLIDRVISFSRDRKFKFKGSHKYSRNEEHIYKEKNVKENEFFSSFNKAESFQEFLDTEGAYLVTGTQHYFANKVNDDKLDYLFVDEAGQFTLADIVAVGRSTKNIILVGDQNQLGSPVEGVHPGESSKSVLNFLLGDLETIPEDKGIFLNTTYRLHPKLNEFISHNFYDDKLVCHKDNKLRSLNLNGHSSIHSEGIFYIQADHEGNSQRSNEEAGIVVKLVKSFLGRDLFDKEGKKHQLNIEDILVISPYNAQTNYLASKLDLGARVGTIDKFQGQEGSITIISMTSSDVECLPRNLDFALDRNRLNVALSRSQLMSIVIFNPRLLDTYPTTKEQLILLNNFCKLLKYKVN
jgi:predicted RecB family nuclease